MKTISDRVTLTAVTQTPNATTAVTPPIER